MFLTMKAKFNAIANDIKERFSKGQPVLIGTISIETSEFLSELLTKRGVPHNVLNAKQHEREAEIVAHAGEKGAITIATNMAGRGTDIKLGQGVVELGGLAVIGTERHEARRIDNQLRGRSGRQGDPGYSRFYLSAEDDLMRRFGSDRFKSMLSMIVNQQGGEEMPLESKMFSNFVESAQKKIEGNNFDSRKNVLEYDEVLRQQREIIYKQRSEILFLDDITGIIHQMMNNTGSKIIHQFLTDDKKPRVDEKRLIKELDGIYFPIGLVKAEDFANLDPDEAIAFFNQNCERLLRDKQEQFSADIYKEFLKVVLLRVVDTYWMDHIDAMSELRQAVRLQAYAQINPLREYKEVGFQKFEAMIQAIEDDATKFVNRAQIRDNLQRENIIKPTGTSSGKEDDSHRKTQAKSLKVGRNDLCPCGSGKKYKNCCGRE
jgi:preprotein translocase subunit SecA